MRLISSDHIVKKRYKDFSFQGEWLLSFGSPEVKSRWIVYGDSGNGKTEFCVRLAKYFTHFGGVIYVSAEQGDSKSMQLVWLRQGLDTIRNIKLACNASVSDLICLLDKQRPPCALIIDSVDYMMLDLVAYKALNSKARKTTLVFVAWSQGKCPKSQIAKDIEYMTDVKVFVRHFVAFPRSRYGGNEPFVIWEEKAKQYHAFLNTAPSTYSTY